MKKRIDKTHWIIQASTLILVSFLLVYLPKTLDLKPFFEPELSGNRYILPAILLLFFISLTFVSKKEKKIFTKSWFLTDFTYWNIFALLLSLIAILHYLTNSFAYGVFTQIFAYIALILGYANELRNEIIEEKVKNKK